MFVAGKGPQCAAADEPDITPTASIKNQDEDSLVIGVDEDDLFLSEDSEKEEEAEARKLKYQDRRRQSKNLQLKIKNYLSK